MPAPRPGRRVLAAATLTVVLAACGDSTATPTSASADPSLAKGAAPGKTLSSIQVNLGGLPAGVAGSVAVAGPNGYARTVTASTLLGDLPNGTYTFTAASVAASGTTYTPAPATQSVAVNKGSTGTATVTYSAAAATTGSLAVTITMPDATPAAVTVTGPDGASRALTATQTLAGLAPGSYTVAAATVTAGSTTYTPTPATQTASVTAGAVASAAVGYAATQTPPPSGLNLTVLGAYLTQGVQTMAGGVPLVAGREGVLRVFPGASAANTAQPAVRARFYRGGALVATLTADAPAASVPTALNEGSATASWNVRVPGSLIQTGLSVLVDVDPTGAVAESVETDNAYPASGTALNLDVRNVPALAVRFVPVLQASTGQAGNITSANTASFLQGTLDLQPVSAVTSAVRAPYTTSQTLLSDGAGWSATLSELRALRTADGATENYYGVAKVPYSSGVAGIGYIGAPVSMGWDYLPSGSSTMAHELGHNWGRQHAPCGGVSGADAGYPYAGGAIGAFGFNVRLGTLIPSSQYDIMGYCSPKWISDYTYKAVMSYRGTSTGTTVTGASVEPGLLVWGRVSADGAVTLEPAVRLTGRSVLPAAGGALTLEALDAAGGSLFSLAFDADVVADDESGERHFAFLVPMSEAAHARLQTLRVRGQARAAERNARAAAALAAA
ncbi:hypothetical protein PYV61_17610, partial [Roseisolibacter sp. H3M3-2]|nr:hypothetical protein [Roseisolibacter sp. H3M3-2]